MPRTRSLPSLLLVPVLLLVGVASGCGGSEPAASEEKTPAEVMALAKKNFDGAKSVQIDLSTTSTPAEGNGVLGASGALTQDPAFEGDVKVVIGGFTATVPVTSIGGKVYAKLPTTRGYDVIDPGEYGAPDPADFADPEEGLSALLTSMEGLEKGAEKRSGEKILTTYSGTVPGQAVKKIIPSADAKSIYETRVGIDADGYATTVKVTGTFFSGNDDVTYDVKFGSYDKDVSITAPPV